MENEQTKGILKPEQILGLVWMFDLEVWAEVQALQQGETEATNPFSNPKRIRDVVGRILEEQSASEKPSLGFASTQMSYFNHGGTFLKDGCNPG